VHAEVVRLWQGENLDHMGTALREALRISEATATPIALTHPSTHALATSLYLDHLGLSCTSAKFVQRENYIE